MGNVTNPKDNKEKNELNSNMRVINSTDVMQNMEYNNMNNFDVNAKMK